MPRHLLCTHLSQSALLIVTVKLDPQHCRSNKNTLGEWAIHFPHQTIYVAGHGLTTEGTRDFMLSARGKITMCGQEPATKHKQNESQRIVSGNRNKKELALAMLTNSWSRCCDGRPLVLGCTTASRPVPSVPSSLLHASVGRCRTRPHRVPKP